MLSFNNDPQLKALHVAQAEAHAKADILAAGTYGGGDGAEFRACSVGCYAKDFGFSGDLHAALAEQFALPEWLWRLRDSMFEGLPAEDRKTFHVEFSKRTPVGVDLEPVQHWLAIARINRMLEMQRKALEANHAHGVHEAIQQTIAALEIGRRAHEAAAGGNTCDLSAAESAAWSAAWSAESAARSAAESAAWSAAESAESAAWSAESAAWSAESAAWSAARSAARSAAESAESAAESAESAAWSAAWSAAESAAAWQAERDALFDALDRAGGSI